ncbi:ABC-F type ribosomal protection protein [Halobacillus salinarum]|uniref:Ribosome protection protein VmlR n=1 Tax=Halobacillus salinarum TaxID=2932257 RepID=A0ABY4EJG9_9BACI|nr:ABC-F type ribosomal protection protein [Halobacillus salinarum]UOQ44218.1 ABC-F type ribosomal protection protein [Halobacillus salinarum]
MKELVKLSNVSYEMLEVPLLDQFNAAVQQGDVIGVIGKNGAGKSTLLQLLHGDRTPSNGQIQWLRNGLVTVMVEQETQSHSLEDAIPGEMKLLEKWNVPSVEYSQLSGGEKLKARLARGLAKGAELLLLDEPTNHLDESSLNQLKNEFAHYPGTIILVSHDRYFLDEVATKIWAIEERKLIEHKGNYSSYMEVRKQKRLTQQREYEKQQKMKERIEGQMNELTSWSKKAHAQSTKQEGTKEYYRKKAKSMDKQVKSKQKRLEKELAKINAEPVGSEYDVRFSLQTTNKTGKRFLELKDVSKSFQNRLLFKGVNLTIQHGEKAALTGPNGSGKTTLLKIIMQLEKVEGEIWVSPSANIGYLTQEVFDLPLEQTPSQLFYQDSFAERGKVQALMKHLGFTTSHWTEPIGNMSMGERVKCKLMAYIIEEKDVLILDEPTNHLDLPSREQLEDTLSEYKGTMIVVSHDRYFLEKTTQHRLVITEQHIEKQLDGTPSHKEEGEERRLQLETERQEILGKLSFMTPNDAAYAELDERFNELTKQINKLS